MGRPVLGCMYMSWVSRSTIEKRILVVSYLGQEHFGSCQPRHYWSQGMVDACWGTHGTHEAKDCHRNRERIAFACWVLVGSRFGLPYAQSTIRQFVWWRKPAHSISHANRFTTGERTIYLRRAFHRFAPTRQSTTHILAQAITRYGEHGDCGWAR